MDTEEREKLLSARAKDMRRNMTPQEGKLWHLFLKRYPIRFRRQVIIGDYILDFYCIKAQLAVEADGSRHYEARQQAYDERRTAFLSSLGIEVLRFTNREIDSRLADIEEYIHLRVQERLRGIDRGEIPFFRIGK